MVKLTAASISNHYCSDSDSDDESSISLKSFQFDDESSSSSEEEQEEQDNLMKKYTYNENNVLVPNESKHTFQTEDPSSSNYEQDEEDDDDDSSSSESSASIDLDETPMASVQNSATNASSGEHSSWKFDLKAMEKNKQKQDADPRLVQDEMKSYDEILSKQCSVDDDISFVSTEERARIKKEAATKRQQALAQKQADRKARMEQVKKRLAKKNATKHSEKKKTEEKETKLDMSDDARRQRVHQWYMRCGMVSKKELRKRIIKQKLTGIDPEDVELLPWNFNETMVNASRMLRYQVV